MKPPSGPHAAVAHRTEPKPCAICASDAEDPLQVSPHVKVHDRRTGTDATLLRCNRCGLIYVDEPLRSNHSYVSPEPSPQVSATSWAAQFPDAVDVYAEDASWGIANQQLSDVLEWQYRQVADLLGDDINESITIVEIGAARGFLLDELRRRHPQLRLIGVEPSPVMAAMGRARGLEMRPTVFDQAQFEPGSVDAIVAFRTFIQVRDPVATLRAMHKALGPSGRLLLDSPNGESMLRSVARALNGHRGLLRAIGLDEAFGSAFVDLFEPGRFYFYSPQTLPLLLEQQGFNVTETQMRTSRAVESGTWRQHGLPGLAAGPMLAIREVEERTGRQAWVQVAARRR